MNIKFFIKYLLLLALSFSGGNSQAAVDINNLYLERLTVKEGLSQGTIQVLLQDSKGFVWIGTENGINIYDGYSVKKLKGPNGKFNSYSPSSILEDSQGIFWITFWDEGLYTYDPKKDTYELKMVSVPNDPELAILKVIEYKVNHYFIITTKSVAKYNAIDDTIREMVDLSDYLIGYDSIYEAIATQEYIYIVSRNGSFVIDIDSGEYKKLPDIKNNESFQGKVNEIEAAKGFYLKHIDNKLYIGTNDGIYLLNTTQIKQYFSEDQALPPHQQILPFLSIWTGFEHQNTLYFVSVEGLSEVDLTTQKGQFLFSINDVYDTVGDSTIQTIMIDKNNLVWLGSPSTGVYIWDPKRSLVKNYSFKKNVPNSLSSNQVGALYADDYNNFWVGTTNGLNFINAQTGEVSQFLVNKNAKSTYIQGNVFDISEDDKQRLWLSSYNGLLLFDKQQKQLVDLPFSEEVNQSLAQSQVILFLDEQYIWKADVDVFSRISKSTGNVEYIDSVFQAIGANSLWNILGSFPHRPEELILSTNSALWALNKNDFTMSLLYEHENMTPTDYAYFDSWVIDKNNTLWLGLSGKGLVGLDANTFERRAFFNHGNSQLDNNIYGVMLDSEGDLWFSSHAGIYVMDIESLHFQRFNMNDGLVGTEFNGNSFAKSADGKFAYGGMNGVSIFDPLVLKRKDRTQQIDVVITNVELLSRPFSAPLFLSNNDVIAINYDDVGLRIDFSTFTYLNTEEVLYKYELKGDENLQFPITNNNYVLFPRLSSGRHILEISAKSPITGEFSAPVTLTIDVSYAPWASPLAYTIYIILFVVIYGYFMRRRHLQRSQLLTAHEAVIHRENRLQLALAGSNSEVWDWQAENNCMFGSRINKELGFTEYDQSYSFEKHIDLIHPEDKNNFLAKWQAFLQMADINISFEAIYRMRNKSGKWLWFKDLGKVVRLGANGEPNHVIGSYTNITQSRADDERAQYFGDVFRQTNDWVVILNQKLTKMTANEALRRVFDWPNESLPLVDGNIGISDDRKGFYLRLIPTISEGEYWRGEDIVTTPQGDKLHVIINITASKNTNSNNLYYICVFTDITAQKQAENNLRQLANYDHLTGLPNRSFLLDRIEHAIDQASRFNKSIALFFIDLDRFKNINDSLGHDCGDILLIEITKRLTKVLRIDDTVSRIGGDEFVVLLETFKSTNQLGRIAQKIIEIVEKPVTLKNNIASVGASIGIAIYPDDSTDSTALLRHADVAMYHAKQQGRNNYQFFTQHMNDEAKVRLSREVNLRQAVKNNEFFNLYQPIVNAHTGKAVGVELLMRWQTDQGVVSPLDFISLAEELGLIIKMTETAMKQGLSDLLKWRDIRQDFYLSVNLSARHFIKPEVVGFISNLLETFKIPANALKLEVTESAFISEPEIAINNLKQLSALGVTLALDDFGTGFSSLSYLKKLPLDVIKIDRSFVIGIGNNKADQAIIDATLVLANSLSMSCIAEGVETKEQLTYLVDRHCHFIQGYLYGKPVSCGQIIQNLKDNEQTITVLPE